MAILDTDKTYVKLMFEECMIKGRGVYVSFMTYATKEDRDREKAQYEKVQNFLNNLRDKYRNLQEEVQGFISRVPDVNAMSVAESATFQSLYEPKINLAQNYMNQEQNFIDNLIVSANTENISTFQYIIDKQDLESLGFVEEWVLNPIRHLGYTTVYAGEFNGEEVNEEFYYTRLKSCMSDAIIDC